MKMTNEEIKETLRIKYGTVLVNGGTSSDMDRAISLTKLLIKRTPEKSAIKVVEELCLSLEMDGDEIDCFLEGMGLKERD